MSSDEKTNRPTPDEERTVFAPVGAIPSVPPERTTSGFTHAAPRADARIQVGDVLNHTYEVRRFIARGGMGEVFEGSELASEERVAIKVMLPALTSDPNVLAMFRKEARTLVRLNDPALVSYRVLAQDPNLGLLYIVTEFIDGPSLCDLLGKIQPSSEELRQLALRLAKGLAEAHRLGAIHRDISPDNILLEGGELERAKIIDFGIAKDLDPSSKTIVGDGFAGKLGYVAPEQLGDFGRDVGPWSDIYSLGLVLLAVASGRNVDMGATLVDAVDRRRAGPDLSPLPDELRPAITRMLKPNPAERFRSMAEVTAALSNSATLFEPPAPAPAHAATIVEPRPAPAIDAVAPPERSRTPLFAGIGAAALLVLGAGAYFAFSGGDTPAPAPAPAPADEIAQPKSSPSGPTTGDARVALNQALTAVPCSWLDIDNMQQAGAQTSVALRGVAQEPARAQASVAAALQGAGAAGANISFDRVAPVPANMCAVLDAFRSARGDDASGSLGVTQPKWEMTKDEGGKAAKVQVTLDLGPAGREVAFFGLKDDGTVEPISDKPDGSPVVTRAEMENLLNSGAMDVKPLGGAKYRVSLYPTQTGWNGFMMLTGRSQFDAKLILTPPRQRDAAWRERFARAASIGDWKTYMTWAQVVDEIPD